MLSTVQLHCDVSGQVLPSRLTLVIGDCSANNLLNFYLEQAQVLDPHPSKQTLEKDREFRQIFQAV